MNIITSSYPKIKIKILNKGQYNYTKQSAISKGFLYQENGIFIPNKNNMFSKNYFNNNINRNTGFFLEILLHSLNYSAKRYNVVRKTYKVDVHKSELFVFKEPISCSIKSCIFKRRLLFFSYNQQLLKKLEYKIKKLKMPNDYTGKGIFSKEDLYKIKKRKKVQ